MKLIIFSLIFITGMLFAKKVVLLSYERPLSKNKTMKYAFYNENGKFILYKKKHKKIIRAISKKFNYEALYKYLWKEFSIINAKRKEKKAKCTGETVYMRILVQPRRTIKLCYSSPKDFYLAKRIEDKLEMPFSNTTNHPWLK